MVRMQIAFREDALNIINIESCARKKTLHISFCYYCLLLSIAE